MANFQFRLQSVLKLRERDRDRAAEAVEQAGTAKVKLLEQIAQLRRESEEQNPVREQASLGAVNVQRLVEVQRFQLFISQQIAGLESNVAIIDKELEQRRSKLVRCEQSLRALERLRDRKLTAWNAGLLQMQQARLDEWAGYRHLVMKTEKAIASKDNLEDTFTENES